VCMYSVCVCVHHALKHAHTCTSHKNMSHTCTSQTHTQSLSLSHTHISFSRTCIPTSLSLSRIHTHTHTHTGLWGGTTIETRNLTKYMEDTNEKRAKNKLGAWRLPSQVEILIECVLSLECLLLLAFSSMWPTN